MKLCVMATLLETAMPRVERARCHEAVCTGQNGHLELSRELVARFGRARSSPFRLPGRMEADPAVDSRYCIMPGLVTDPAPGDPTSCA